MFGVFSDTSTTLRTPSVTLTPGGPTLDVTFEALVDATSSNESVTQAFGDLQQAVFRDDFNPYVVSADSVTLDGLQENFAGEYSIQYTANSIKVQYRVQNTI